jgi:hypothetical protein
MSALDPIAPKEAKPIGGFFEAHALGAAPPDGRHASVLGAWTEGRPYVAYVNARSALAALARMYPLATIWLPAFLCAEIPHRTYAARTRRYPVAEGFTADLEALEGEAQPGDLVLAPAFFGASLSAAARAFMERRDDLMFIEDCAHALAPVLTRPKAGVRRWSLFSPRKLLGVADGGLLVARTAATPLPEPKLEPDAEALWLAPSLRKNDPFGRGAIDWRKANQMKEAAMSASHEAMTAQSLTILAATPIGPLASARRANWLTLHRWLHALSAAPEEPVTPPLGYLIRLGGGRRDDVLRRLHGLGVFAAVHWPAHGEPEVGLERDAAWARELITLPCDHRYDEADMQSVADRVLRALM